MKTKNYSEKLIVAAGRKVEEKEYWLNKLSGKLEKTSFPCDYKKTKAQVGSEQETHRDFFEYKFDGGIRETLEKISKGSDYTVNIVLQAAVAALLHKYTGSEDIIVGAPIYKQDVAGDYINTVLVLRNKTNGGMIFKDLLMQIRQTVTDAVKYRNYPLPVLLDQLGLEYGPPDREFPLFDIAVLLKNIHNRDDIRDIDTGMIFSFERTTAGVSGVLEYNSLLYEESSTRRVVRHLMRFLEKALENVDLPLAGIEILTEDEKRMLLFDFNDTLTEYGADKTICRLFSAQVDRNPHHTAIMFEDEQVTYQKLDQEANRLAHLLKKRGVDPNRVVGVMLDRSIEMITVIMGILKSGGAYLPLDPDFPQKRIVSMLEDCSAAILVSDTRNIAKHSFTALQNLRLIKQTPHRTLPRAPITDFEQLPIPDRSLVNYDAYNRFIGQAMVKYAVSIQATRGCPYHCAFCHKIWPKTHSKRSAENVFAEVDLYYRMGVRRFALIDDIFNLDRENSMKFFNLVIENGLEVKLFFPNGVRGDILTKDYIDLMIKAGTISMAFALETASPRLQKIIKKNLNLEKLRENLEYIASTYPHVVMELFTMHGFPSETKEEAKKTLDFIKSIKWLHFPYVFVVRVYPDTDMEEMALAHGVKQDDIDRSDNLALHELPDTLPFEKSFTLKYQADFFNNYFLSKERLINVLPYQMNVLTEDEIVQKYNSYLPKAIHSIGELMEFFGIKKEELEVNGCLEESLVEAPALHEKMKRHFPQKKAREDAFRILLLDLSQNFSHRSDRFRDLLEPPLGLMNLLTYLNRQLGDHVKGRIAKAQIDFDNFDRLKALLDEFKPQLIGIRTLNFFKDFFHETAAMIRQWGIDVPVITGGPYGSSGHRTLLQDPNVDVAVFGEGEITFFELVKAIMENKGRLPGEEDLKKIEGIAFIPRQGRINAVEPRGREILMLDMLTDTLRREPVTTPPPAAQSTDPAYVMYTSGSTGKPKGTLINHHNVNRVVRNTNYIDIKGHDRVLQLSNYAFDGSVFDIYGALLNGAGLVMLKEEDVFSGVRLTNLMRKKGVTVFFVTTAFFNTLVEVGLECFRDIRKVLFGGEKISIEYSQKALDYLGKGRIVHVYGPTETTVYASYYPIDEIDDRRSTIPIGRPIANTFIYILDTNLGLLPVGAYGEIYIGGAGVSPGYLNNRGLTREKFIPNPFIEGDRLYKTGDLGRWLPDGNIEFLGRKDQQVKMRGFRIELQEVENRLLKHESIKEAVVTAGEDYDGGGGDNKYLCAYIVAGQTPDNGELKRFLAEEIPDYMVPSFFIYLDELPFTSTGKVDRMALPSPFSETGFEYVAPRNDVEIKLQEIWSELLGVEKRRIGIDTGFFEMGGHSLNAIMLISKIHEAFDVAVPFAEIFKSSTIRELGKYIKGAAKEAFVTIEKVEEKDYYVLSSAQKRLYILQQIDRGSIFYNLPQVIEMAGEPSKRKLESAFEKLIARHESLRTSFEMAGGVPVQKIHPSPAFRLEYFSLDTKEAAGGGIDAVIGNFIRPFDLSHAPLLRAGLITAGQGKHILLVDMHHIISDGLSQGILENEFMALYHGQEETLPEPRLQYKDYSEWQQDARQGNALKKQEAYWLSRFEDRVPVIDLPIDFKRPEKLDFAGDYAIFEFSHELAGALRKLAAEREITLFMALLAIFNVFLHKISGGEDIIVGTAVAGRRHADLQPIIGMFVNTLALRNCPRFGLTFKEFLREVKQSTSEAFENQDYQFEDLVDNVAGRRELGRNPLFDIMFTLQEQDKPSARSVESELTAAAGGNYEYENRTTKFDLTFTGVERQDKLYFSFQYRTRLFKKETIKILGDYFLDIAAAVLNDNDIHLKDIKSGLNIMDSTSRAVQDELAGIEF